MKQMSLSDVLLLRTRMENMTNELISKRQSVSEIVMAPDEDFHDYIDITVDDVSAKIVDYIDALCYLNSIIFDANVTKAYVEYNGKKYMLADAIYTVKMHRREANFYARFGNYEKRRRIPTTGNNNLVKVATFNIAKYKELAQKLTKENDELSKEIDRANLETLVDVDEMKLPAELISNS